MTNQEIYTKIETIYNTEKGRPFIVHLIMSFLPIANSTFMLENTKKKVMRCAITNTPLISKGEFVMFQIENHEQIFKDLVKNLLGEDTGNVVADKFKGKAMAIECEKSERTLCLQAVQQLLNFVSTESLKNNTHIAKLLSNMRKVIEAKETANQPSTSQSQKYEKKFGSNQVAHKNNNNNSAKQSQKTVLKSTTNLADSDVLQNLKKQLESAGK